MKTYRTLLLALFVATIAAILLSGCHSNYKADEVHRSMGIKKETAADGTVTRKAETLTHTTTIGGFTRSSTYKGAEVETAPARK